MNDSIRVFVNARRGGSSGRRGRRLMRCARADPALAEKVASGAAYVTDGRGIEIDTRSRLAGGAILRVVVRARARSGDADA